MPNYTPKPKTNELTAEQAAQEAESAAILAWLQDGQDDPTRADNEKQEDGKK